MRPSLYSPEMAWLRQTLVGRRLELNLTQKMLAERMGGHFVVYRDRVINCRRDGCCSSSTKQIVGKVSAG